MTSAQALLLATALVPWLGALGIFAAGEVRGRLRNAVAVAAAAVTAGLAAALATLVLSGERPARVGVDLLGIGLALRPDALGVIFAGVAGVLWLVTTVYALGYMSHASDRARFFGFFAVCVGSAIGIALSANLLTLFVFYEALTLATYPLVVHSGTPKALAGGRTYLIYSLSGGVALALGLVWLAAIGGMRDFAAGGVVPAGLAAGRPGELIAIFALLIAGFGVKAALFPAHGWLPAAMVAPAPVSALLHAVAVVKAGVFGIARVVLFVYGPDTAGSLGVLAPLAALAAFTLLFASVRALRFDDIKKRLAYSTVGQLSYIVLGLALGTPLAAAAAVAHLVHHAVLKITMFFTAGVLAEELGVYRVSQMNGVGRRMPVTMTAFSVAALGIIGVAPISGFVSKWGLGAGALQAGEIWPVAVLAVSSVLNAAYLLPMVGRAWFESRSEPWKGAARTGRAIVEADGRMVWPLVVTATAGLGFGLFAGAVWTPVSWASGVAGLAARALVPWRELSLSLDAGGVAFLALAVVVWLAAAVASWRAPHPSPARFRLFFTISALASVLLAFASDPAAFYACFSAMALSAYALVVDDGSARARAAGRAYLAFTVLGEALLLTGLLVGAAGQGAFAANLIASPWFAAGTACIVAAFALKTAALGVGGWMPLAYGAVARGAGAAFAGVVSSAGVLGLVRFAPGGVADLESLGSALVAVGLASAFLGALVGVAQREPRHVLAYSSVSQFGLMWLGVGAGLMKAALWPAAVAAVAVYLLHHGLAKAALFAVDDASGAGRTGRLARWGAVVPALALAGAPLTSGAVAKIALKGVAAKAPEATAHLLEWALPLAAVGTTLLMARFLALVWDRAGERTRARAGEAEAGEQTRVEAQAPGGAGSAGLTVAFGLLVAVVAAWVWLVPGEPVTAAVHKSFEPHYLWVLAWPVGLGALLAAAVWALRAPIPAWLTTAVPPGDVWAAALRWLDGRWVAYQEALAADEPSKAPRPAAGVAVAGAPGAGAVAVMRRVLVRAARLESGLTRWAVAGTAFAVVSVVALLLMR